MSSDGFDGVTTGGAGRRRTSVVAAGVAVLVLAGASFAFAARSGDDPDTAPVAADQVDVDGSQAPSGDAPPDGADGDGPDGGADDAAQAERDRADAEAAAERAAEEAAAEAAEAAEAERLAEEERAAEEARLAEERAEQERLEAEQRAREEQERFVAGQQRLIELGYLVGAADGEAGQQTTSAVMAFQAVNGLSVDGALGPQTYAALDAPRDPALRGGPATRLEVDMDRQVLHLVEGGQRVTTMKVSTGRGGTFESAAGETLRAETPVGTFTIDRRIAGEKPSSYGIGSMWDPMYFHGPWAIHGSPNVPAGPASSGCVRVALADGRWLFDRVPNGTPVVLYGGTHVFTP